MIEKFFDDILEGNLEDSLIKEKLGEMHKRGESVEEIVAAAKSMIKHMKRISPCVDGELLDIVGTGGDGKSTLNISTIAAFVAAGAGCKVAKHCNKGASSRFGSVDLLEELGIDVNAPPEKTRELIEKAGIGFMYAPIYHPAMKNVAKARREMGHRTIFNLLGPLTNPAGAQTRLIGAYDSEAMIKISYAARELGIPRVIVVHSSEGLDEISPANPTEIFEYSRLYTFYPSECNEYRREGSLRVDSAKESAEICRRILCNEKLSEREEAMKAAVLFTAGFGIYINTRNAKPYFQREFIERAADSIRNGNAYKKLKQIADSTKI